MKNRLPVLSSLTLLLILVIGTWWAADYTERAVPVEAPPRITHEPDAWATHFVMLRTDPGGIPINRLEGERMFHYPDDDSYEVMQVRTVGQRADLPITIGTARQAVLDEDGSRITLRGQAHLRRLANEEHAAMSITSEMLVLLPDADLAQTDLPAQVIHGQSIMRGVGMQYDNRTRQLRVLNASDVKIAAQDVQSAQRPAVTPPVTP